MQTSTNSIPPVGFAAAAGSGRAPVNLAIALALAEAGIPVYPCAPDKRPRIAGGYRAAVTDRNTIIEWFTRWPTSLAAIPTGPQSGFFVLDVDGAAGRRSLNALFGELEIERPTDLSRVVVRTPSGGLHFYFTLQSGETPRSRASDIALGLDTRGIGGGIIAPGNRLPDGRSYELIDVADLPDFGGAA